MKATAGVIVEPPLAILLVDDLRKRSRRARPPLIDFAHG
jgi:hypothetical protein